MILLNHILFRALLFLLFCGFTVLWWAALWFALPVDLSRQSPGVLLIWHGGPPLAAVTLWWLFGRVSAWRADRQEKAAQKARKAARETAREAGGQAHRQALAHRCACVECRAVWVAVPGIPRWYKDKPAGTLLKQDAEKVRGAGREAALFASLQQVFKAALQQCKAVAGLPLYIAPGGSEPIRRERVMEAWRLALTVRDDFGRAPLHSECSSLSGEGDIVSRALELFERDPALPAFILLGMDSPLGDAPEEDDFAVVRRQAPRSGHAVVAMLLSRPGLSAPPLGSGERAPDRDEIDLNMLPYWERDRLGKSVEIQWRVPLLPDFWILTPFAALHRMRHVPHEARPGAMARRMGEALEEALIDAGLRDWPSEDNEPGKDSAPEKSEPPPADEAEPLELGWLVHDAGDEEYPARPARLVAIADALKKPGCEIDLLTQASNVVDEQGDTGAARDTLMLAEALIHAARCGKPALMAMFAGNGDIRLGFAQPVLAAPNFLSSIDKKPA
ncbi:MAG: hypothetical protein LBT71_01170 [Azoarcus sp.]|jgi:hypothetical protein|nr:hypothetical protein [Azoarcus sp.]